MHFLTESGSNIASVYHVPPAFLVVEEAREQGAFNMTGHVRTNLILRRFRVTVFAVEKTIRIKYDECVSVILL